MDSFKESDRAKKAALLAERDSENIKKNGVTLLEYYRGGLTVVEIAALTSESEDTTIRIAAIRSFINRVNSIISLIKSHVDGLSTNEIAKKLNIEMSVVRDELEWFQQSKIIVQKGEVWIHKKYE